MEDSILQSLSGSIANSLKNGIKINGSASFVVCGGKSPLPLYKCLSRIELDWSKISIFLGDDRVVCSEHEDSNVNLIKKNLLINHASKASFHELNVSNTMQQINHPFDVVLLGLGSDGHFASLFPAQLNLNNAFDVNAPPDLIISEQPLGSPSYHRISMNLSLLLNTNRCILLVTNSDKRRIVEQAYTDDQLPLHFLLTQDKSKIEFSDLDF